MPTISPKIGGCTRGPSVAPGAAIVVWKRTSLVVLTVLSLHRYAADAQQTVTQVTTTTYMRNADGAPTAIVTQIDNQPATTTYLTWDNFLPNTTDPTTGTVSAGNGNLLGFGPMPGTGYTTQLQFDQRNRLTSAAVTGTTGVTYSYDAFSCMASTTLTSGDALQFYYNTAANEVATNIYQPVTGTWSSYLDQTAYLSDGVEQVRFQPRKDVAGQYDNSLQSFSPLTYEPYGAPMTPSRPPTVAYDMTQNPFQYGGEFVDPVWGGYYFRARWYLPAMETFASRDPDDVVRRYSYADANPVINADPSGLRSLYGDFRHFANKYILKPLMTGPVGYVAPLFIGSELTTLEIAANPGRFWESIKHDSQGADIFLAASIAAEVGGAVAEKFEAPLSFRTKLGLGGSIGVAQSITAGVTHRRFNYSAFGQSLAFAANAQLNTRYFDAKLHYNKMLSIDDVNDLVAREFKDPQMDTLRLRAYPDRPTGPVTAWLKDRFGQTPQRTYEVSIGRGVHYYDSNEFTVEIEGEARVEVARERYNPLKPAKQIESIEVGYENLTLKNSRYEIVGRSTDLADSDVVEYRTHYADNRPQPFARRVWSGCVFALSRIRGWVSILHF